jgi:hypothetical protein
MPKTDSLIPVYIPWDTFTDFIKNLRTTGVPSRIDKSILMHMPALTRGQILSALRFLKLIDEANSTKSGALTELADSFDTTQWPIAVKEHVVSAFDSIVEGLELEHATPHQLDECFDKVVDKEQMRQKSERFYLSALTAANIPFSPHLVRQRAPNGGQAKTPAQRKPRAKKAPKPATPPVGDADRSHRENALADGMIDFPLPLGKQSGFIRVPKAITMDQYPLVEAMLNAVKVLAQANSAVKS